MPAYARREIVLEDEVGVYHCTARCVRRAFLCGVDPVTGRNYEHRKEWIRERLEHLASIFAIEICNYAVMSNHLHVILRARPDLVPDWSADEIALRWKHLFPSCDPETGDPIEPSESDINMIVSDPVRVAVFRRRLSHLSWFMRCLNEPIARRANREDGCTGRFWEGRFASQALLDEAAVLTCSIYVDLNPIRAGVTETPEQSRYTSAYDRIRSMPTVSQAVTECGPSSLVELHAPETTDPISAADPQRPDSWLCELTLQEGPSEIAGARSTSEPAVGDLAAMDAQVALSLGDLMANSTAEPVVGNLAITDAQAAATPGDLMASSTAEPAVGNLATTQAQAAVTPGNSKSNPRRTSRASDQGYLPIPLDEYLSLLDWTGRQFRAASRGTIPAQLAPILERLGVTGDRWVETVQKFGRWFKTAAGRRDSLATLAQRRGKAWLQGQCAAALAFR